MWMTTISRLRACCSVLIFSMISSGVPIGWVARRAARLASATPTSAVWRLRYRAKERVERDNAPSESAAEGVPAQARHLADDLVGRRESGRAIGERGGDVLRIRGQDEQWVIVLEDDARIHEAAGARARLVGDLGAEGQERGQAGLELLPAQDVEAEAAELGRAPESRRRRLVRDAAQDHLEEQPLVAGCGRGHLVQGVIGAEARRNAEAVDGPAHADRLAEALDLAEADEVDHGARARVVADDDHHDEGVAEGDPEAGGQVLEGAGVVVLVLGVDGHLLVEGELAVVDGLERGHHDGDLPRARRGHRGVSEPVGRLARGEVLEVPARLEGEGVAQRVHPRDQVSHQGLLAPWVVMTGGPASALLPRRSWDPGPCAAARARGPRPPTRPP